MILYCATGSIFVSSNLKLIFVITYQKIIKIFEDTTLGREISTVNLCCQVTLTVWSHLTIFYVHTHIWCILKKVLVFIGSYCNLSQQRNIKWANWGNTHIALCFYSFWFTGGILALFYVYPRTYFLYYVFVNTTPRRRLKTPKVVQKRRSCIKRNNVMRMFCGERG